MMSAQPRVRTQVLRDILSDLAAFSRACYPSHTLHEYQLRAARPILAAMEAGRGGSYVVLFCRQSGKDETLAQLEAFLLARYRLRGGSIVMACPTADPQAQTSRSRLAARTHTPFHPNCHGKDGYIIECGHASVSFLSADEEANPRSATASLGLIANEAQDIEVSIWDPRFAPMAAYTDAPSVYSGTPFLAGSLLSREEAAAPPEQVYKVTWEEVAAEVPAYGRHVAARIKKLG